MFKAQYVEQFWTEVKAAGDWYEQRRRGYRSRFIADVIAALDRAMRHPEAFPVIQGNVRRVLIRRFEHLLVYAVEAGNINFLGVVHAVRDLETWLMVRLAEQLGKDI